MSLKIFILSPLERTLALRQGFQPLSDYRFNVKLTPRDIALSRVAYAPKPKKPGVFPFSTALTPLLGKNPVSGLRITIKEIRKRLGLSPYN